MATSFVQSAGTPSSGTSATTVAATFGAATQAGATILLLVTWGGAATITGIADSNGNTWPAVLVSVPDAGNTQPTAVYALHGAKGTGSANTITVTFSGSSAFRGLAIAEYRGTVDKSVGVLITNNAGVANFCSSGAQTTNRWAETIVGLYTNNSTATAFTVGTNFTSRFSQTGSTPQLIEDLQQAAPGSQAATATLSSGAHAACVLVTLSGQSNPKPIVYGRNPAAITRASYW